MHRKLYFLFFIFFAAPAFAQGTEGISWDEVYINDKIKLTITQSEFEKRYKKADSITDAYDYDICPGKDVENIKMYFYRGIKYELENGTLNFRSIDFSKRKAMYFAIDGDWFDHTTSLKSFHRSFPEESQYVEDIEDENGEEFQRIVIFPKNLSEDYEWNFDFRNGKLFSIEFVPNCQ